MCFVWCDDGAAHVAAVIHNNSNYIMNAVLMLSKSSIYTHIRIYIACVRPHNWCTQTISSYCWVHDTTTVDALLHCNCSCSSSSNSSLLHWCCFDASFYAFSKQSRSSNVLLHLTRTYSSSIESTSRITLVVTKSMLRLWGSTFHICCWGLLDDQHWIYRNQAVCIAVC
jgi:hypothetical protein